MAYSFDDAYQRIMDATGASTQVALAEIFGVKQSSVSEAKSRGDGIPATWLVALVEKFGLNPQWIKTGCGLPYLVPAGTLATQGGPLFHGKGPQELAQEITRRVVAELEPYLRENGFVQ